jgi:hypothetical protein
MNSQSDPESHINAFKGLVFETKSQFKKPDYFIENEAERLKLNQNDILYRASEQGWMNDFQILNLQLIRSDFCLDDSH